ncbi:MAG: glycosyltransferase family 2 protein [Methylobacter sp.]|nr:glycosyltransferase family 2 protein [Methylobacter sp.]
MQADAVIVNWNAGIQLRECVDSVIQHGHSYINRIIVIDNGSTDGSENAVEGLPNVTLIRAGFNLGFGKACNLGAAQASTDFILFLNPDARLFADTLAGAFSFMQRPENAKVGICGVQLIDEQGHIARSCTRFPSACGFAVHATGLDRIIPKLGHFMSDWDHTSTRQVDQVIGAFFLLRRTVFNALHGFDETFFLYFEDLDISYRAKQMGWSSTYFAEVKAFHAGGGTSKQVKAKRLFYTLRSRTLYAFKHFSPVAATMVLLVTLFVEPLSRSALAVGQCSWTSFKETLSAYGMMFQWLPRWIFKGITR